MSDEVESFTRLEDQRLKDEQFIFGTVRVHGLIQPAPKLSHGAVCCPTRELPTREICLLSCTLQVALSPARLTLADLGATVHWQC